MSKNSQILEAVGGLAAEKLVNGAPRTAEYVGINRSGTPAIVYYDHNLWIFKDGGTKDPSAYSREGSVAGLRGCFNGNLFKLSELRTAISQSNIDVALLNNFKIGNKVAPISHEHTLASGSERYSYARVVNLDPFQLISERGDMFWSVSAKPEGFRVIDTTTQIPKAVLDRMIKEGLALPNNIGTHINEGSKIHINRGFKICLKTEDEQNQLQEFLFSHGYKWIDGNQYTMHFNPEIIYFCFEGGLLSHLDSEHMDFEKENLTEIKLEELIPVKPEINIDGDFNPDSRHISPACRVINMPECSTMLEHMKFDVSIDEPCPVAAIKQRIDVHDERFAIITTHDKPIGFNMRWVYITAISLLIVIAYFSCAVSGSAS